MVIMDKMLKNIKICSVCQKEFKPNKFHPRQKVCNDPECQHKRQIDNQKSWRNENPNYFKYKERQTPWERKRAEYLKIWKSTHKNYFKIYRLKKKINQKSCHIEIQTESQIGFIEENIPKNKS